MINSYGWCGMKYFSVVYHDSRVIAKCSKNFTCNTFFNTFHHTWCRDPSPWETRGTQLIVTRGTCYQPDRHYPDSPKDMHGADILSGPPQGKANDVSSSPIQGRANDAGRAYTSG